MEGEFNITESTLNQTNYNAYFREDLPRDPLKIWKEVLNDEFDNAWNQSVTNVKDKSVTLEENNPSADGDTDYRTYSCPQAVFAIASGSTYPSNLEPEKKKKAFDLSSILPARYLGEVESTTIDVAPIPKKLQQHREGAKGDDELLKIFSKDHIQRLFSAFLGTNATKGTGSARGRTEQPVWDAIEDAIRSGSPPVKPKGGTTPKEKATADGLSRTMNEHIVQLETSVNQLWIGTIYKKSLDHLLRILLRIHLAPHREKHIQDQADAKKNSKKQDGETRITPTLTMGQWRPSRQARIPIVLHKLVALARTRPTPKNPETPQFGKIESQLASLKGKAPVAVEQSRTRKLRDDDDDIPADKFNKLKAICRILLESSHIERKADAKHIRKSAFAEEISDREYGSRTNLPPPHVCLRAPFLMIANTIFRITGHPEFARDIAPHASIGRPNALILGATGSYEALRRSGAGYFDVKDGNGTPITSIAKVTNPAKNKEAVLGAFLDLRRVKQICNEQGIEFSNRMMYVDRHTVRLVGKQI
ncbi:MAG: hypothetical protein J3Q66DRAFT_424239 [Benniella sp.]|nr:MAG: hypothetical protein J3Q66DRAFT_424239 [Benniella sp.]